MTVTVTAPAKVNLTLDVVGRRPDGYHNIKSVMQAVSLADTLTLTKTDSPLSLSVTSGGLSAEQCTIAWKAAELFFAHIGRPAFGVHIHLTNQVPIQAGMGGGSADAAGVLVGLNALTGANLSMDTLCALGSRVGADVPFCLLGGTAVATGIGDKLQQISPLTAGWFVIVKPPVGVSTAVAYEMIDHAKELRFSDHEAMCAAVAEQDLARVGDLLCNGFEQALALTEVMQVVKQLTAFAPLGCRMTGSGSAVFAVFATETAATRCLDAMKQRYADTFLCRPVPFGARVENISE